MPDIETDPADQPRRPSKLAPTARWLATFAVTAVAVGGISTLINRGSSKPRSADASRLLRVHQPPTVLPKLVENFQDSALKVGVYTKEQVYDGSGVKIGRGLAVTAGHVIRVALGNSSLCGKLSVQGVYDAPRAPIRVNSAVSNFDGKRTFSDPDWALMGVGGSTFERLPAARLTYHSPAVGEPVFFVNYQRAANGQRRYPDSSRGKNQRFTNAVYGPAEYAGVVIHHSGDYMSVATGFRDYSDGQGGQQTNSGGGSSGGAVITRNGQLFGISVRASKPGAETVSSIERQFQVELPLNGNTRVGVTDVQGLTTALQPDNINLLNKAPRCSP